MFRFTILVCFVIHSLHTFGQNQHFVPLVMGGSCCCGEFVEIFYPNLDFEDSPAPPPGGLILYSAGDFFSGWTCTRATIDHKDGLFGNLTLGNPNGRSNFIDLHGSPGFGAIEYNLTGLTPGNTYRVDFWTAQNGSGYTSTGTLKIAGGAWRNVNWIVNTDGSVFWFKESHLFMAMATSAKMEFSSVGGSEWGGTLLDDIKIFECPGDQEEPIVNNPPEDFDVECDTEIPKVPVLSVSDNCDLNPDFTYKETIVLLDPCTKVITRTWDIKDDCGNIHKEDQIIKIQDNTAPEFIKDPEDKWADCASDVQKQFNDWIKKNGNSIATDACGKVSWRTTIDHDPKKSCDTILVEFIAIDHCGQESSAYANFYILDTMAPKIIKKAEDRNFFCISNTKDSLKIWLRNNAFANAIDNCDTTLWSNNFDGDSLKSTIKVQFYARDLCGNLDSTEATFQQRNNSDTFRIFQTSCTISQSTLDTLVYTLNGCDSIVILENTKVNSDTTRFIYTTCDASQNPSDTNTLKNIYGCDSLIINLYILKPKNTTLLQDYSCNYILNTFDTIFIQGQFCDSIVITERIPLKTDSILILNKTCDTTQSGIVFIQLKNQFSCDSIIQIITSYAAETITKQTSFECGLKSAFTDTLKFSTSFCDSLVIIDHLPLSTDSIYLITHTCNSKNAGIFKNKYQNNFGCDSIVVQEIILDPTDSISIYKTSCNPLDTGNITTIFTNKYGCDSMIVTKTSFIPGDSTFLLNLSCNPNETGIKITYLKNKNDCDSVIVNQTDFLKADTTYINKITCNPLDQKMDTTVFQTNFCDSTVITNIQFIPSDTLRVTKQTCNAAFAGLDTLVLNNSKGCDSIIFINTQFVALKLKYEIDSISCFDKNDGSFRILNKLDFGSPFQLISNQKSNGNIDHLDQLKPGMYQIYVKDNNGCITDSINFNLFNPAVLITDLGTNLLVEKGATVDLKLQSNATLQQIFWQPTSLTSCQNCQQISLVANQDIWIYTLAIDERNCSSLDSLFIKIKKSSYVYAPNAISANGDQINDFFYLIADETSIIEILEVYNRWGELLFSAEHIQPNIPELGWNGSFKNKKMNPGVYIYYAKLKLSDGRIEILKGDFTLIR
ncbi:MAG: gliding motility-associated C-terminal domain-containing protein [Saprospiraceae bacterium]|nr:gliding motility-associated C-terminal domain-containing protein [Saprospiraceae bacterium]